MKVDHLRAFVWLRYRLFLRQMQRGGAINTFLHVLMAIGAVISSIGAFFIAFLIGTFAMEEASPTILMYVWDGIVVLFVFAWMIGLLSELQRSEALSIDKFLHLPVSISGIFLLNYLSSLLSVNLFFFVPLMLGLALGLVFSLGPALLLGLPLVLTFFLMVTALTYQLQGWLASLMVNPRRRRTVIVVATLVFVLLFQLPNMLNIFRPWETDEVDNKELKERVTALKVELQRARDAGEITPEEFDRRIVDTRRQHETERKQRDQHLLLQLEQGGLLANVLLPPGWLPFGMRGLAEGEMLAALLGMLGFTIIGAASLWRAYRTTLRLYTGAFTAGTKQAAPTPFPDGQTEAAEQESAAPVGSAWRSTLLLERTLPWVSEQAAAIALAGLRSHLRAPEAKLLLLMPIMIVVLFGGMHLRMASALAEMPAAVLPFLAFGTMAMIVLSLVQLVGNQFGFDRGGFRAFVLSPVPRCDILLGKNLAVAPITFTLCIGAAGTIQGLYPMRVDRFLALGPQLVSMFLIFCMLANWLSIFAPIYMPTGAMRPPNARLTVVLYHMWFLGALSPALAVTLLPVGIELVLEALSWVEGMPIALVLSLLECALIVWLYRAMLTWQGKVLQNREQRILETVTTKAE